MIPAVCNHPRALNLSDIVRNSPALKKARQEASLAGAARDDAARRLDGSAAVIRSTADSAYRDPAEAAKRYLSHLQAGGRPEILPADLGRLRGSVLRAGNNYLPLGTEGAKAYQIATDPLPRLGAVYLRAREDLAQTETRLCEARRKVEQLEQLHRPQIVELSQLRGAARQTDLPERVMSMRPRDQIALARVHGAEVLTRAAERAPQVAGRAAAAREWWMRNLAPQLDRVLDRQLGSRRIPSPAPGQSPAEWMANAVRQGLRPAHAAQALTRAGASLGETLRATSRAISLTRAVVGSPAKTAAKVAAQALGVPALPVRLAVAALSLVRSVGRALTR